MNSTQCHTSKILRFIDHHLHLVVKQVPSYIKDTNNFINKVYNFSAPANSILVTMDINVRSLNTVIPNNKVFLQPRKGMKTTPIKLYPPKLSQHF